jgi:hypothetical protein
MREFVGEHYLPAEAVHDAGHCAQAARAAADQLRREGTLVHHVRSILIPEDETCIHLYRAESIEAVRVAAARASLRLDRLTEAVSGTGAIASPNRVDHAHRSVSEWRMKGPLGLAHGLGGEPRPAAGPGQLTLRVRSGDAPARLERYNALVTGHGGALLRVPPF